MTKWIPDFSHADLLTVEEAEKLPLQLRKCVWCWWLRSPGYFSDFVAYVSQYGYISRFGCNNYIDYNEVRPALRILNLNDCKIGLMFKFGGQWFQIIDENTAFCLSSIGEHRFDGRQNDYEKSHIKRYIDNWFKEAMSQQ